ncbi:hypothetical protein CsSME_00019277 [Camellia sinensis var. sinensis]
MGENEGSWRCVMVVLFLMVLNNNCINGEDPYRFYTWNITYGDIYPLGVKQQGILINGQFPGPQIESVTNDNLIISVFNSLDEPFLISWNGVQQRRNSWQDGVYGTNCPIPPRKNFTYVLQVKDQIGSYFYFPSLAFHKAAGGFGGIKISSRSVIPVPFNPPAGDYTILAGDWFKQNHTARLTGSGFQMLGLLLPLTSESRGIRCSWLRWKAHTRCRILMTPSTSIWGSPTLYWLLPISLHRTTIWLSQHVSPPQCSRQHLSFITVTQQEAFPVLPLVDRQLRLIGHLTRHDLLGTLFVTCILFSCFLPVCLGLFGVAFIKLKVDNKKEATKSTSPLLYNNYFFPAYLTISAS